MANVVSRIGVKIVSIAIGIPVGIAAKKSVERVWRTARPNDPPRKPTDPEASWGDALGWAALSAAGVAVAELITTRSAASIWRKLTGSEQPTRPAP